MKRQLFLMVTMVLAFTGELQLLRAGDKDQVHTVGKAGLTIKGKVAAEDAKVKVISGDQSAELPAKLFLIRLTGGKKYRLTMDSKEIDSVLIVQENEGRQLAWDDDSGGGLNSMITLEVSKDGIYKIYAAALKGAGNFILKVQEPSANQVYEVGANLKIAGELGKVRSIIYNVKLVANKTYIIDMVSANQKSLDPFLRLLDAEGNKLAEDDDGGEGLNARIRFRVATAGTYQIVATSFGEGRGSFTLIIREAQKGTEHKLAQIERANQLNGKAIALYRAGKFREAVVLAREALGIHKEIYGEKNLDYALCLNLLAKLCSEQGNSAEAEPLLLKAIQIRKEMQGEKHPDYAQSLNYLALLYFGQGDYTKAEPLCLKALEIRKEVQGEKDSDYAQSLNNLASIYNGQGNYINAKPLLIKSVEIYKVVLGEKHPDYAFSLNNLATLYSRQGNYAEAESLCRQSLKIRKEVLGEKHRDYAESLETLAHLYFSQANYSKAETLFLKVIEIRKEVLGEKHRDYAESLHYLAASYRSQGNYAEAEPLFLKALKIRKEVLGEKHPDYAQSLNSLAFLFFSQANYSKAETFHRQAIKASQISSNHLPFERLGTADVRLHPHTIVFLGNYARSLEKLGRVRLCDHTYFLALDVLDRVRQENLDQTESKIQLNRDRFDLFPARINVLRKLFYLEQKLEDLEAAVATAEQGTARAFLESIGKSRANLLAGISPQFQNQEKQLLQDMRLLDLRIDKESAKTLAKRSPEVIGQLHEHRHKADENLKQLITQIEKEYPQYAALKYPRPCSLQQARECLAADEVALLFVPGSDATYLVLVEARPQAGDKANGITIVELPGAATLAEQVAVLTDPKTLALPARVQALGRDTFDMLLGPCQERIKGKHLVIVPNGSLGLLPFELLVEEDGKYLVEKHRIRYAPSLTALHLLQLWKKQRAVPQVPLFAVGDPLYEGSDPVRSGTESFKRLVHSGAEVDAIAKLLHAKPEQVLTRERASKARLHGAAKTLAQARYVHFATHGILGVDRGQQPALVLNRVGASVEDGFLKMDEITGLKLNADLVVLSACQTGQGRIDRSEGVTGLARAFLYAGSKGVVCSLWSVDDRETAELMVDFYTHLQKGRSAPEALRKAQLAMIRAGKAPIYWAPFILIGE